ncbi:hypothetical protein B1F79_02705 [Coxiella-like endosymbiont of Rhipicephalus sanguineus]|nr:hypothetical protein [Coxiella-like endosymbiont of Rhipicephalus sanguineus]
MRLASYAAGELKDVGYLVEELQKLRIIVIHSDRNKLKRECTRSFWQKYLKTKMRSVDKKINTAFRFILETHIMSKKIG